jgi:lipoyl(octanoyl) transferase
MFECRQKAMTIDWEAFTNRTVTTAEVRLLGLVDLPSLVALQKLMIHEVRLQSRTNAAVLLYEHPPTISVGQQGNFLELPADTRELEAKLISVHKVRRNGHSIMHQPGQLIASVIVSLPECSMDEQEYHQHLRDAVIRTCSDQQVVARERQEDLMVIDGRHGIVAELATAVDDGVTSYGIFLNVNCRLDEQRLVGRGTVGERISSLDAERLRPTSMQRVRASLIQHLCEGLGYPEYHIHTSHPFLKRTKVQVHDKFADH